MNSEQKYENLSLNLIKRKLKGTTAQPTESALKSYNVSASLADDVMK